MIKLQEGGVRNCIILFQLTMKTFFALAAILALAVAGPVPLIQVIVNVNAPGAVDADVIDADHLQNPEEAIVPELPSPVEIPEAVQPEIVPQPVELPQPVIPEILPTPVELPAPVIPEIIPEPVELPEATIPEIIPAPEEVIPEPVVVPGVMWN